MTQRYSSIVSDDFFTATAQFLDTPAYESVTFEEIYHSISVVVDRYWELFIINGCEIEKLKGEARVLYSHVTKFLSKSSATRSWPQLLKLKSGLGLHNILHIAELCIAIPLSNAECERIFSFLWRQFSKERGSLGNDTLELILQLHNDKNFSPERYDHAIELFLTQCPDGTVRKRRRHIEGHNYPFQRKTTGKGNQLPSLDRISEILSKVEPIENIDLALI